MYTSDKLLHRESANDELDNVTAVLDDSDGVRVQHALRAVAVDLQQLITHLQQQSLSHEGGGGE